TCSSIGVATDCSTVSASDPVYTAVVWIWGGAISGNCATGSRKTMTAPAITKRMAITIATTGLPMKNLDTVALSLPGWRRRGGGRRVRLRVHHDAVLHLLQALGHDAFACLQPLGDDPEAVHLLPHLYRAARFRMLLDPIGEAEILPLGDRERDLHRIELGDGRQHGGRGHQIADLDGCDPGDAGDG